MKKKHKILTKEELKKLQGRFESIKFHRDTALVYENHIPNTGVVLVDGELILFKRSKVLEKLTTGVLLGVHQMINNEPVKVGCKVRGPSEVILLNKSEIKKIIEQEKDQEIHDLLLKIV